MDKEVVEEEVDRELLEEVLEEKYDIEERTHLECNKDKEKDMEDISSENQSEEKILNPPKVQKEKE